MKRLLLPPWESLENSFHGLLHDGEEDEKPTVPRNNNKKKKQNQNWLGSFLQNENKGMTTEMPLSVTSKAVPGTQDLFPCIPFLTIDFPFSIRNYKDLEYSFVQEGQLKTIFRSFICYLSAWLNRNSSYAFLLPSAPLLLYLQSAVWCTAAH